MTDTPTKAGAEAARLVRNTIKQEALDALAEIAIKQAEI